MLPFDRFPGVDTLLGPEMRSTGEVMGVDITFGLAFAKSQMAAGTRLPDTGTVFLSLADRDKPAGLAVARIFAAMGLSIAATLGTAGYFRSAGLTVDTLVAKVGEEGVASDAVELIAQGKVQLVINTPRGLGPRADGQHIRMAAITYHVPCLTTLAAARAAAAGMADAARPPPGGALAPGAPRRRGGDGPMTGGRPDLAATVGSVSLPNPIMTASGTSGHGTELADYGDLGALGAVVVKSLSVRPWPGNPAPRVHEVGSGMLNSVGLQGPGLEAWLEHDLPALSAAGARVVVSIWGQSVAEFGAAADLLAQRLPGGSSVVAVEVNVSCPNVEDRSRMFAHSATATHEVLSAIECGLPRWAKLSPNVPDIVEIAAAALRGGAEGLTLVNTLLGLALDLTSGQPVLGGGGGGLSGAVIHPVAVRAVWECRAGLSGRGHRRRRGRLLRPRRGGVPQGGCRCRPGRYGDLS